MNLLMLRMIFASFLVPPGLFIVLILTALFLYMKKRRSLATALLWTLISLLMVLSSAVGEYLLVRPLESPYLSLGSEELIHVRDNDEKTAIVILSGGIIRNDKTKEVEIGEATLKRLFGGFKVYQETGFPICVSGGMEPGAKGQTLAEVMGETLKEIGVSQDKIIYENKSRTTWENAEYSIKLLESQGFKRIILVTDAVHMRRSVECFSGRGVEIIPFPSGFLCGTPRLIDWLPNSGSLNNNLRALHEWEGLIYYRIRY